MSLCQLPPHRARFDPRTAVASFQLACYSSCSSGVRTPVVPDGSGISIEHAELRLGQQLAATMEGDQYVSYKIL
jgi:hypothetical protein